MWVFGKAMLLLIFVAATSVAIAADDLTKLKASLAERFARYGTLRLEYTTTGPDPLDFSKSVGSKCLWERTAGQERYEVSFTPGDQSKSVLVFDGSRTTIIWHPDPHAKPTQGIVPAMGSANLYRGTFSTLDSSSNTAAWLLGLITGETRTSFLQIVSDLGATPIPEIEINDHSCLAWNVSGNLPDGGIYTGRLAVDVEAGWLPVLWETESKVPGQRDVLVRQTVTETMEIIDEKSGDRVSVPKVGQIVFRVDNGPEYPPLIIEFHHFTLGRSVSKERFLASIPDGYRVRDETSSSTHPKEYISGGPDAEQQYLAEIAAQTRAMQASQPAAIVNASIPEGSNWSLWLIVGAFVLAVGSLFARRL